MVLMTPEETLQMKLKVLSVEHQRLNELVDRMAADPTTPHLDLQRMKKQKLALKDEIEQLRDRVTPDIIA